MQTGALIVAAGKSSRMGDFKPMLQLGSISIAQRVINNFRQAGISKAVPTGKTLFWTLRFLRKQHIMFTDRADWTVSIQIRRRLYCMQIRWEV